MITYKRSKQAAPIQSGNSEQRGGDLAHIFPALPTHRSLHIPVQVTPYTVAVSFAQVVSFASEGHENWLAVSYMNARYFTDNDRQYH